MKKQLFWMIGAALALTSCSNDEQVAVNPANEITFRPIVTRAAETKSIDQTKGFMVTAYFINSKQEAALHIQNDKFVWNGSVEGYVGDDQPHYWDVEDDQIVGQAWAAYGSSEETTQNVSVTTEATDGQTFTYKFDVNDVIENQVDFISANIEKKKENVESGIELNFKHQLSQIEIKAKKSAKNYNIKIKEVKLGNIKGGSAQLVHTYKSSAWSENEWNLGSTVSKVYSITCGESSLTSEGGLTDTETSLMPTNQVWMLFPQTLTAWTPTGEEKGKEIDGTEDNAVSGAYIGLLVDIDHAQGGTGLYPEFGDEKPAGTGDYAWVYVPLSGNWQKGTHYVYTLNFTDEAAGYTKNGISVIGATPVKFTVKETITAWTSGDNSNITMDGKAVEP